MRSRGSWMKWGWSTKTYWPSTWASRRNSKRNEENVKSCLWGWMGRIRVWGCCWTLSRSNKKKFKPWHRRKLFWTLSCKQSQNSTMSWWIITRPSRINTCRPCRCWGFNWPTQVVTILSFRSQSLVTTRTVLTSQNRPIVNHFWRFPCTHQISNKKLWKS